MPKDTFYHLNEEKKSRIVNAALAEFARHDYEHVNIQNIVKDSHISRGSFYQYFDNLDDLFGYLVDLIVMQKKAYLDRHMVLHGDAPFLDRLAELYRVGYQFALDNKVLVKAGKHMIKPVSTSTNETVIKNQDGLIAYYKHELQKDIDRGDIKKDVDIDMLINIISLFLDELLQSHFIEQRLTQAEVDQRFKRFITLLKKGIE